MVKKIKKCSLVKFRVAMLTDQFQVKKIKLIKILKLFIKHSFLPQIINIEGECVVSQYKSLDLPKKSV